MNLFIYLTSKSVNYRIIFANIVFYIKKGGFFKMNDIRGSIWRKWDLHVHTPNSYHQNFGDDWDLYVSKLKENAVKHGIEVMGVTDYFSVDGYEKLKNDYGVNKEPKIELPNCKYLHLIPCVELRIEAFDNHNNSINIHVAFDPKIPSSVITQNFIEELSIKYQEHVLKIKKDNLIRIGYAEYHNGNYDVTLNIASIPDDLKRKYINKALSIITIPLDNLRIKLEELRKNLILNGIKEESFLVLAAYKGHGSLSNLPWYEINKKELGRLGNLRQTLLKISDICFSNNSKDRDFLLGKFGMTSDEFISRFGSKKPIIWGSDSHDLNNLFHPSQGNSKDYTWIKADPTFEGLRQIINEPEERVFIGEKPDKLQHFENNKTKYIKLLNIKKNENATIEEKWFDNSIHFNPNLVAIIGNKGSGKSALADILGLLCDTNQSKYFSFLNENRFKQKKNNKASFFEAELVWADGHKISKTLSDSIPENSIERARYIPQNYFENICNETEFGNNSSFNKELKKVIFSYIDESDRLQKSSLDELIEFKTEEKKQAVKDLKDELEKINKTIVKYEDKISSKHQKRIENEYKLKLQELEVHESAKPEQKEPPKVNEEQQITINLMNQKIREVDLSLKEYSRQRTSVELSISEVQKIIDKVTNLESRYKTFISGFEKDLKKFGISVNDILKFEINYDGLYNKLFELQSQKSEIEKNYNLKSSEKEKLIKELETVQNTLDSVNIEYQRYLMEVEKWEQKREEIIGSPEKIGTVKFYRDQLNQIKEIPAKLEDLYKQREQLTEQIYQQLKEIVNLYETYYSPIQNAINNNKILNQSLKLTMEVNLSIKPEFKSSFLNKINKRARGSFKDDGEKVLTKIIDKYEFNDVQGVLGFVRDVMDHLKNDYRQDNPNKVEIEEQLRNGESKFDLYNLLFSLDYLEPNYIMKLNDKEISKLSPGERGILLLVFYLLLDKDDIPLIIDQPEDNLDNQTIYNLLVPCIREAKKRRQIFIVTHNPNLAVVCDAEQIICANIQKEDGNKITYECGAIESPKINNKIIDILEGTRPAFNNRDSKYFF
ncbi:ABC transporter [Anoxybacillus flavithermus NBRC 109594]|uniref:ABC transporter n=2 Tax=Anoxybacillus flavithermus TaxID=33934 RepID=R4G1W3_9BACL|nr:ABC transporter [Anoxybacillus flavithermus NBRC 109594]